MAELAYRYGYHEPIRLRNAGFYYFQWGRMGLDRKDRGQGCRGEFSEDWANTGSFLLLFVVVVTEASF